MDKWDDTVNRIKQGMLAEEPEAALAGGLELLAHFGRAVEQIGASLEKMAQAQLVSAHLDARFDAELTAAVRDEAISAVREQQEPIVHDL